MPSFVAQLRFCLLLFHYVIQEKNTKAQMKLRRYRHAENVWKERKEAAFHKRRSITNRKEDGNKGD
jgi:hypothetical protein